MNPNVKFTVEDYMSIGHDEKRYELIEGELLLTPSPIVRHQRVLARIGTRLRAFVEEHELGEVFHAPLDVVLSRTDVVQPDIFYIAANRTAIIEEKNIQGPPDLVVEILSPATAPRDEKLKRTVYGKYGVKEYWIVDLEQRAVEVIRRTGNGNEFATVSIVAEGAELTTPLLSGFSLSVSEALTD